MRRIIAGTCENGSICPTIFDEGDGTLSVQGYIGPSDISPPDGEAVVRIPADLLLRAAKEINTVDA
jgi:hypothetical protein